MLMKEPDRHYVLMTGQQYLHLDPATWTWHLTSRLTDLEIWDYHHDLDCFAKPKLDGKRVRYVALTDEQLALIEGMELVAIGEAA